MADFFHLADPIIAGMFAQLQAHAAAETAAINSTVTDGRTIEPPAQILDYAPTPSSLQGNLPLLGIGSMPSRFEDDLVHSVAGVHQLAIIGVVAHADPGILQWQLRRYARLILNLIQLDRTYGGVCRTTVLNNVDPGPLVGNKNPKIEADWLSWVWVIVNCTRDEY